MHIPDNFIDHKTAAGFGTISAFVLAFALNKLHQVLTSPALVKALATASHNFKSFKTKSRRALNAFGENYLRKLSTIIAIIFVAQMIDFPIPFGTTGHLIGSFLAALILGPWGGSLAMSLILIVQAVFYSDGGLTALGANIFNMAILGSIFSYYIYYFLQKLKIPKFPALAIVTWLSVVLMATACSLELSTAGKYFLADSFSAMLKTYSILGIFETILTLVLVKILNKKLDWKIY